MAGWVAASLVELNGSLNMLAGRPTWPDELVA